MELVLGSHVREHGNRIGRLAGFELEAATRLVRRIVITADGDLGPSAATRSLSAISLVHDGGEIELHPYSEQPSSTDPGAVKVGRSTKVRTNGRDLGRLAGFDINPADGRVVSVLGRHHWWSRRFSLVAPGIDCSTPGELTVSPTARAA